MTALICSLGGGKANVVLGAVTRIAIETNKKILSNIDKFSNALPLELSSLERRLDCFS